MMSRMGFDKLQHAVAAATLTLLLTAGGARPDPWRQAATIAALGLADEFVWQRSVSTARHSEWADAAADAIGAAAGAALAAGAMDGSIREIHICFTVPLDARFWLGRRPQGVALR